MPGTLLSVPAGGQRDQSLPTPQLSSWSRAACGSSEQCAGPLKLCADLSTGAAGGQQGLLPGAFPAPPFPWAAAGSLPSGQVAEAYAQQMHMAALSMMQASRGPQEERGNCLDDMAAAQQHLAAMFQQGYNSYMMGSMVRPAAQWCQ